MRDTWEQRLWICLSLHQGIMMLCHFVIELFRHELILRFTTKSFSSIFLSGYLPYFVVIFQLPPLLTVRFFYKHKGIKKYKIENQFVDHWYRAFYGFFSFSPLKRYLIWDYVAMKIFIISHFIAPIYCVYVDSN